MLARSVLILSISTLFEVILVITPAHGDVAKTRKHFEKGEYSKAIKSGEENVQKDSSDPSAWYWLGLAYRETSEYDKAISALQKIIALKPDTAQFEDSHFQLGRLYVMIDDYDESIRWYTRIIDRPPQHEWGNADRLYYDRSHSHLYRGMYQEALWDIEHWAKSDISLNQRADFVVGAYFIRAFCYVGLGDSETAQSMIQEAYKRESALVYDPWWDLLRFYFVVGDERELEAHFGLKAWAGIEVEDHDDGVLINSVVVNSPAERGGLLAGDLILKMNVDRMRAAQKLVDSIDSYPPGSMVDLEIKREKKKKRISLPLGSKTVDNQQETLERLKTTDRVAAPLYAKKQLYDAAEEAESNGEYREAFQIYLSANPTLDSTIVERVIRLYKMLDSPPAIPEEARKQAIFGQTAVQEATADKGYDEAIVAYGKASSLAPWWADMYHNLAVIHEKRCNYAQAVRSLVLALLLVASSDDPEARSLQDKLYELEYKASRK